MSDLSEKTIAVECNVNIGELIDSVVEASDHDELFEMVKRIDEMVAEWSFTILLADYFAEQRKKFEIESDAIEGHKP